MSSDQSVAHVQNYVVQILNVAVTFPIPTDEVSRFQFAQRKNFLGITSANQNCVHQSSRPRFAVGRWHAARNFQPPGAVGCRLRSDTTRNEMRAIIANRTLRHSRASAKISVAGAVRPKI